MTIDNYRPYKSEPQQWAAVAPLVQKTVTMALPETIEAAQQLLRLAFDFIAWATEIAGLDLDEMLFHESVVERFAEQRLKTNTPTGRRKEFRLRMLAAAALGARRFDPSLSNTPALASPYEPSEFAGQDSWAIGLRQHWRRRDARFFIALGRGAGLEANEMISLRMSQINDMDGVMVLSVGTPVRQVPVFFDQAAIIRELIAEHSITDFLLTETTRQSSQLGQAFHKQTSPHRPSTPRLRSTWIVRHLNYRSPLREFLEAAGLESTSTLNRYLPYVDVAPESVCLLAGNEGAL